MTVIRKTVLQFCACSDVNTQEVSAVVKLIISLKIESHKNEFAFHLHLFSTYSSVLSCVAIC